MRTTSLMLAAGLAICAGACATDNSGPYGPSQGYVYPAPGYGHYSARQHYSPPRYGYSTPYAGYGNAGPSITLTRPVANVP